MYSKSFTQKINKLSTDSELVILLILAHRYIISYEKPPLYVEMVSYFSSNTYENLKAMNKIPYEIVETVEPELLALSLPPSSQNWKNQ